MPFVRTVLYNRHCSPLAYFLYLFYKKNLTSYIQEVNWVFLQYGVRINSPILLGVGNARSRMPVQLAGVIHGYAVISRRLSFQLFSPPRHLRNLPRTFLPPHLPPSHADSRVESPLAWKLSTQSGTCALAEPRLGWVGHGLLRDNFRLHAEAPATILIAPDLTNSC